MSNSKAEFAIKMLKQYAAEMGTLPRGTSDISPLEEWLIIKLFEQKEDLIYLGLPYSHPNKAVTEERIKIATQITAKLLAKRLNVIAPAVYGHEMTLQGIELPNDWEYWKNYCLTFLKKCSSFYVLTLPGWEESPGLTSEIQTAHAHSIPIFLLNPETLDLKEVPNVPRIS